jgi:lipopolysaccharide/colanic/teichoic acid biosynthesis glycosyltransferase
VSKLEEAIPFYSERTFWVRPGITGLAQVNQRYDTSLGDVRSKTAYDHAYAAHLGNVRDWLVTDLRVLAKTALIVLRAEGQ